jgi:hypothetical protein
MTFRPPVICVDRVVLWNQKRVVRVTALPILGPDNEGLGHPVNGTLNISTTTAMVLAILLYFCRDVELEIFKAKHGVTR